MTLIVGILGIHCWQTPKHAKLCLIFGSIATIFYLPLLWWGATRVIIHTYVFQLVRIEVGLGFLLVYVMYIVGAYRLKQIWHTIQHE
ncbi:MAG: hypothetical protein FWC72_08115 [Oscillospiraceae bacterium]|nr:hypothetical protein [Oscillospiraceae bacterium]